MSETNSTNEGTATFNQCLEVLKIFLENVHEGVPDLGKTRKYLAHLKEIHDNLKSVFHKGVLENKYISEILSSPITSEPAETNTVTNTKKSFDDYIKEFEGYLNDVENSRPIPIQKAGECLNELKNIYIILRTHHQYTVKFTKCEDRAKVF